MVNEEVISRKLSQLNSYISQLRETTDIDWKKYQKDIRSRAFVERYLHLAIEEVIDIANHFVSFNRWREPRGYRDLFLILAEHKIIPPEELSTYQNMASFRNMLVHHYEKIDEQLVFGIFKKHLGDFDRFIEYIKKWIMDSKREPR